LVKAPRAAEIEAPASGVERAAAQVERGNPP
jgi:hypothetical protein